MATSFLAEVRRRNILRAGAVYAAAAWLLVQVATQVFPFFHIAEGVVRGIIVAAVICLPLFLGFAWYFEITPDGLKRQSEVEPSESITHLTARKLDRNKSPERAPRVSIVCCQQPGGRETHPATWFMPLSAS